MRLILLALFAIALCGPLSAQTKTTGTAKSGGPCSAAVTGDNNTFHFEYCGSDPEEGKRMIRLLNAVAQGQVLTNSKLDQILELLLKPTKITATLVPVATPASGHPRAAIDFYTEDPVERGQFEIVCDHACTPVEVCQLMGQNSTITATVSDEPRTAEFLFQRQFPALTSCKLTVESRDEKPITILSLTTSRRITNLVKVALFSSMVTAGSTMQ